MLFWREQQIPCQTLSPYIRFYATRRLLCLSNKLWSFLEQTWTHNVWKSAAKKRKKNLGEHIILVSLSALPLLPRATSGEMDQSPKFSIFPKCLETGAATKCDRWGHWLGKVNMEYCFLVCFAFPPKTLTGEMDQSTMPPTIIILSQSQSPKISFILYRFKL